MIIDANYYWFMEEIFTDDALIQKFLADIPRAYGTNGLVKIQDGIKQIVIERPTGYAGVNYIQGEYTFESQLESMDLAKIDKVVMKVPCCHEWMSLDMCRLFNNGMADYAKRSNGRMVPLAVIPPFEGNAALKELDRCHHELGMNGIQMSAHYGTLYLDDNVFAPLFEKLEEYHMTVYVHHTPVPVECTSLLDYNNLRRSYGRCIDQMTAVCREMMSGMFEKYPHVRIVHSMLGGGFFAYKNMMIPPKPKTEDAAKRFDNNGDKLQKYLQNNLFFELSHAQPWGKDQLECAVKVIGADHIVYGSSYPVRREWLTDGPAYVMGLDITEEEKEQILWKNAARLYSIK